MKHVSKYLLFWGALVAMFGLQGVQMYYGAQLKALGHGIVAFELAGNVETANRILDHWGEHGATVAITDILWDFPYILAYTLTLSFACLITASWWHNRMAHIGKALAKAMIFAAMCDISENITMFMTLHEPPRILWVMCSFWLASFKFFVVGLTCAYLLISILKGLWSRFTHSRNHAL